MYDVMRMCALFRKQLNFPTKHPWFVRDTTRARARKYGKDAGLSPQPILTRNTPSNIEMFTKYS